MIYKNEFHTFTRRSNKRGRMIHMHKCWKNCASRVVDKRCK